MVCPRSKMIKTALTMQTQLCTVLRASIIPGGSQFSYCKASLCVMASGRNRFHSFAPILNAAVENQYSFSKSACSYVHASAKNYLVTKEFLQTNNSHLAAPQYFSTSRHQLAKELSEKGDLVYRGAISGMIKGVKIFSLSTSMLGICLQPMLFFSSQELPTGIKLAVGSFINFFIFMNPFIIHYIAKKYVTELRWNRRTGVFSATTFSFFVQRKELQFTAEDVKVPDVPGMFTHLEAKGAPLFLDSEAFEDKEAYICLMGFDKPLDWEMRDQRKL